MQSADLESFNQAVVLANAGRKQEARTILAQLLGNYPNDPNVLLWFAFTTEDLNQSRQAIQKVRFFDPNHPTLPGAESWLAQQEALPKAQAASVSVDFLLASSTVANSTEKASRPYEKKLDSSDSYTYNNSSYSQQSSQNHSYSQATQQSSQQAPQPTAFYYQQERPDFFGRLALGWQFLKQALILAKENPGLVLPSLYALGANTLIGLFLGLPLAIFYSSNKNSRGDYVIYIALFLVLLLNYLVTYFFSAVTIHLVYQHLTSGQGDKKQAWAAANNNGITILIVAAVSALVATIRTAIRNQRRGVVGLIARMVIGFIERLWTTATFFILPAIVLEDRKLGDAVGRATYIMRSNLLQLGVGYIGLALLSNLLGFITMLGALGVAFLIFITLVKASLLAALILAGLVIIITLALTTALQSYLKIAYYTCLFKWACDSEKQGSFAQAPAILHSVLARRAYNY